jgi:hypothetical protein
MGPLVAVAPDPVHGKLLIVTLSRRGEARDGEVERALRAALDRFTIFYKVCWRTAP